jgi:tRNA (mo5U34)-methyltransferase
VLDYAPLWRELATHAPTWAAALPSQVAAALRPEGHGDLPGWYAALADLPRVTPSRIDLTAGCLRIGDAADLAPDARARLADQLMAFHPWRKGPFCPFGIHLDTEWRSDWKWERVAGAIDLAGRRVLDVGCGNGYYGWRMLGAGARLVVGVDPTLRYVMQYAALRRFIGPSANYVLPLKLEACPAASRAFDVVFSMGVLYHRRDPLAHLADLMGHLQAGGQLVLETLVVDEAADTELRPGERYAKMKNVFAIPSPTRLRRWLAEAGYRDIRVVDVTPTTPAEQRRTPWMTFESLADFLDPADPRRTIEGHPAPLRAVVTCSA